MDRQELETALRRASEPQASEIKQIFSVDTPLFKLAGEFLRLSDERLQGLAYVDLAGDEGRLKAITLQADAKGLRAAVDIILDYLIEAEEKKDA